MLQPTIGAGAALFVAAWSVSALATPLNVHYDITVRVDPARARQIVEGMLDAAKERTRNGASIVIRLRASEAGAVVTVEDDSRVAATIGPELTLATRLAELLGTELTADGSTYRVVFPNGEA